MDIAQRKLDLLRLQAEYQKEVRGLSKGERTDTPKDFGEQGVFQEAEAKRLQNLSRVLGRLCGVDRAIRLIEKEGWKGNCVDCAEAISDARIKAIPWATRCISCATRKTPEPVILHTRKHGREVHGLGAVAS